MALEKRGNNYYYYKKEREGKCVVSSYVGKGEIAVLIAEYDDIERQKREYEAFQRLEIRRELEDLDRQIYSFENKVKELTAMTLISRGFYKTKSRQWRIKNDRKNTI